MFEWLRKQSVLSYRHYEENFSRIRPTSKNFSFVDIEKAVFPSKSYEERQNLINGNVLEEINDIVQKNNYILKEQLNLKTKSLQDLISDQNDELTSLPAEFINNKLLVYLVRNGYIDESYRSLMSYFYEGSLSIRDMAFILSIRDKNPQSFDYSLDMLENLTKRLEVDDFSQDSCYNLQLAIYLSTNGEKFQKKYETFVNKLKDGSQLTLQFLERIRDNSAANEFFKNLFNQWTTFADCIFGSDELSKHQKQAYLILIVTQGTEEQWNSLDKNGMLTSYAKETSEILTLFAAEEMQSKFKDFIYNRELYFDSIEAPASISKLFDFVIQEERYEVSENIFREILNYKGTIESKNEELQQQAMYSAIKLGAFEPLLKFIHDRLPQFVETIILGRETNTKESEENLIDLLNKESLSEDLKTRLIETQEANLISLDLAPKNLWNSILNSKKVIPTWANVLKYFNESEMSESLITYINDVFMSTELGKVNARADKSLPEEEISKLWRHIIKCNDISDGAYESLLTNCPYYYIHPDINNLTPQKVKSLIRKRKIRLNEPTFNLITENFSALRGLLIKHSLVDYIKSPAGYDLGTADFAFLLDSDVSSILKTALLPFISNEQLLADDNLVSKFRNQVLKDPKYVTSDQQTIEIIFDKAEEVAKKQILNRFGRYLPIEIFKHLLQQIVEFVPLFKAEGTLHTIWASEINIELAKAMKKVKIIEDFRKKKELLHIQTLS